MSWLGPTDSGEDYVSDEDSDNWTKEVEYPKDERIFHIINQYISLKDDAKQKNNLILNQVLNEVIRFLKDKDSFFQNYFQKFVYAGSYYKGTKVGAPDEFDLNLVIRLPVRYGSIEFEETVPGYTKLKLRDDSFLPGWNDHKKKLSKWLNYGWTGSDGYLRQDKFRQWMEGLLSNVPSYTSDGYQLRVSKSGPAFTLTIAGVELSSPISVDLVPVLEFRNEMSLRRNGIDGSQCWYAVPKPLEPGQKLPEVQWRISFYTLERDILRSYDNAYLKPVIRQIKKLRDRFNLNFASYYIETIFLTEIRLRSQSTLRRMRATQLFLHMLGRVQNACETQTIVNYWDPKHNLISHLSRGHLSNIAGQLKRIITRVIADPLSVADYILTAEELQQIQHLIDGIRYGATLAPMPNEPLDIKEPEGWCTIV